MTEATLPTPTTHTYMARVWYRDTATLFNIASFLFILIQDQTFVATVPAKYHPFITEIILVANIWIRFQSSTRPVALSQGQSVQVQSIAPAAPSVPPLSSSSVSKLPVILLACVLGAGVLGVSACGATPPPTLSPAGQAAVTATQVIKALDVIRDTVVELNKQTPPIVSTADMLKVVNFHESAVKTILAVPSGWKATVESALAQLQKDLPADTWNRMLPYITLYETLVAGVA